MSKVSLNPRTLKRAWWTTPAVMTLTLFMIFSLPSVLGNVPLTPVPLVAALFFGLCGMAWGYRNSANAVKEVGTAFGVSYLDSEHALSQRVAKMAGRLDLSAPTVGVMRQENAFAVGADASHAAVIVGKPLIETLAEDELDAVIGHELGHIATDDMRRMQFAEGYQRMFSVMLSVFLANLINAFTRTRLGSFAGHALAAVARNTFFCATELIVKATSRHREYYADAVGAALTSPDAMQRALKKLHQATPSKEERQFSCLMFYGGTGFPGFSTHPTLAQRIAALETQAYLHKLNGDAGPSGLSTAVKALKVSKGRLVAHVRNTDVRQHLPQFPRRSPVVMRRVAGVRSPKPMAHRAAVSTDQPTEPTPLALPRGARAMAMALVPFSVCAAFAVFVILPGLTNTRGHVPPVPRITTAPATDLPPQGTQITTAALQPAQPPVATRNDTKALARNPLPLRRFTWTRDAILTVPRDNTKVADQHMAKLSAPAHDRRSAVPPPVRRPSRIPPARRQSDPDRIARLYSVAPLLGQLSQYLTLSVARRAENSVQRFLSELRRPTSTEMTLQGPGVTHIAVHALQKTGQCWHYAVHALEGKRQIAATNLTACPARNRRWRVARQR